MEALERGGEVIRITIPDLSGYLLDRQVTVLDQLSSFLHPRPLQAFHRRKAKGRFKRSAEVTRAQSHHAGQ